MVLEGRVSTEQVVMWGKHFREREHVCKNQEGETAHWGGGQPMIHQPAWAHLQAPALPYLEGLPSHHSHPQSPSST